MCIEVAVVNKVSVSRGVLSDCKGLFLRRSHSISRTAIVQLVDELEQVAHYLANDVIGFDLPETYLIGLRAIVIAVARIVHAAFESYRARIHRDCNWRTAGHSRRPCRAGPRTSPLPVCEIRYFPVARCLIPTRSILLMRGPISHALFGHVSSCLNRKECKRNLRLVVSLSKSVLVIWPHFQTKWVCNSQYRSD